MLIFNLKDLKTYCIINLENILLIKQWNYKRKEAANE